MDILYVLACGYVQVYVFLYAYTVCTKVQPSSNKSAGAILTWFLKGDIEKEHNECFIGCLSNVL